MSNQYIYKKNRLGTVTEEQIPLSTKLILEAAEELGITWDVLENTKIIRLSYMGVTRFFRYQVSPQTSYVAFNACLDKGETKALLKSAQISTPKGAKIESSDTQATWLEFFKTLQKPLVVKPSHGQQGSSVFTHISDQESYIDAVTKCFTYTDQEDSGVIVEEMAPGREYRILATKEKVLAALYREPANVVGDGTHTLQELVNTKNSDPRRGHDLFHALHCIDIDDEFHSMIKEVNVTLETVIPKGEKVYLRRVSNIARGGDSIDVTDIIHPSIKEIAIRAIKAVPELNFAGIDFMTTDINAQQTENSYAIIEINSSPSLYIHELAYQGSRHHIDKEFLYLIFPELLSTQESL